MQGLLLRLLLIFEPNGLDASADVPVSPADFWTPGAIVFCALGLTILSIWMIRYGGFGALREAPERRNRLYGFEAIIFLGVWLVLMMGISLGIVRVFEAQSALFREALSYPLMALLEGVLIAAMGVTAHLTFARRLKGFGLAVRTMGRDALYAAVYLLAVYPLILLALWAVLEGGRFVNDEFQIQVHQSLSFLGESSNPALTVLVVVFAVVIVPVFEEMLFRGFLQTSVRSLTGRPWAAIVATSLLFSLLHPLTHVPALFCLSVGLGYAYERSGSLFRPLFMHIFFNGISVAMAFWVA